MPATAVAPARPFEFRCLGPVLLTRSGGERVRLRTRKQSALLLLLARRKGLSISRDDLIELLWSEDGESHARHSLSQSISLINKLLGGEVIEPCQKNQLRLREGTVWLDVAEFEAAIADGRSADAQALWRGGLFEGQWIPRAPNFERWLTDERERLARQLRAALRELLEGHRAAGDWQPMSTVAEALLDVDALDEGAMLAYLEALALHGERTLALRRYGEFERRLREELDAEPGSALRGWIKRHRKGDGDRPAPALPMPRVSDQHVLPAVRPVYGRQEEFAMLWERWETAQRSGAGTFLIMQGEAGIGKSALAGKLLNQVHVGGGSVCLARCYRTEKSVPFAPVTALIRQLSRLPGFVALGDVWIGELTRLVPELRQRFPNAPQPMAIDESARHRLSDGVVQATECVADEQPLLVVVDDIQDADEASLALLHYLGRSVATQPIFLICIARAGVQLSEFERTFFDTARAAGLARFVTIGALHDEHIGRIAQQVFAERGLEAPDLALAKVRKLAEGNPLHAIEAALAAPIHQQHLLEDWLHGRHEPTRPGVQSFEKTAIERLGGLSPAARSVANVLAVAGRPLSEYDLPPVVQLSTAELAAATQELEDAGFLRRIGVKLGYAHESYLKSVQEGIGAQELRNIHKRLAAALAKGAHAESAARYEVAQHLEGAGRRRKAAAQAMLAAEHAASIGALRERAAALELADRVSNGINENVIVDLAACHLHLKEFDKLSALSARARTMLTTSPSFERDLKYFELAADHDAGRVSLGTTRDALLRLLVGNPWEFTHEFAAWTLLMRLADKSGQHLLARRAARQLRQRAANTLRPGAAAYRLQSGAYIAAKHYWPAKALPLIERALAQAERDRNWDLELFCRDGLGAVLKQLGRYPESAQHIQFGLALSRKTLNPQAEAVALNNLAVTEMAMGRFDAAEVHLGEMELIDATYPHWPFRAFRMVNQGVLALLQRDYAHANRLFESAYNRCAELELWQLMVFSCGGIAMCAVRSEDFHAAAEWCDKLQRYAAGREAALTDGALVESAMAWNTYVNQQNPQGAFDRLRSAIRRYARRDVDHWLALQMEAIRLREHARGEVEAEARRNLVRLSLQYGARGIADQAAYRGS